MFTDSSSAFLLGRAKPVESTPQVHARRCDLERARRALRLGIAATALACMASAQNDVSLVSRSTGGVAANGTCGNAALSADGRFVSFTSLASTLAPNDTNARFDVFVHDRQSGVTQRASVSTAGLQGSEHSLHSSLSADGRFVAFDSDASTLTVGDNNSRTDVFVRDMQTSVTTLVSATPSGTPGNDWSEYPSISDDGRLVAFASSAGNLVPGDTNSTADVFVRDLLTNVTTRVSVGPVGAQANAGSSSAAISADGRHVAFSSVATNLVAGGPTFGSQIYIHDRQTGVTLLASASSVGAPGNDDSYWPSLSADGSSVAFRSLATNLIASDTNGHQDIFVHDFATGLTTCVSVSSNGAASNQASWFPSISASGRHVAFDSLANNLVSGDTNGQLDVFVHDRQTGVTTRRSVSASGAQASLASSWPSISANGAHVAFASVANNLVVGDVNGQSDIFVSGPNMACAAPTTYCTAKTNSQSCTPAISFTGMPSSSGATAFQILGSAFLNQKSGLLFYGPLPAAAPFQGGFLCVANPITRTPVQSSGGSLTGSDCTGAYSFDFGARIVSGIDPSLTAGAVVHTQYWARDPADPTGFNTSYSNALSLQICP